jgi:uncharacterized LabA/DUF88 family protein
MRFTSPSYADQRVGIFIDVQNLYHSAKNLYRSRVNYAELIKNLVGDRKLIRAIAYVVKSEGVEGLHADARTSAVRPAPHLVVDTKPDASGEGASAEGAFFEALEKAGLELRMKDLQIYPDGTKKADWDIGMAVDAMRMSSSLDVIILVTGDGDFLPLIDYLKWGPGRVVEVAAFRRSASAKLQEVADRFVSIEDVPRATMRMRVAGR